MREENRQRAVASLGESSALDLERIAKEHAASLSDEAKDDLKGLADANRDTLHAHLHRHVRNMTLPPDLAWPPDAPDAPWAEPPPPPPPPPNPPPHVPPIVHPDGIVAPVSVVNAVEKMNMHVPLEFARAKRSKKELARLALLRGDKGTSYRDSFTKKSRKELHDAMNLAGSTLRSDELVEKTLRIGRGKAGR